MNTNILKVPCDELEIGMFISELDRPWLETPFLLQGIKLESLEEINLVKKHCSYVYVDLQQSTTNKKNLEQYKIRTLKEKSNIIGRQAYEYIDTESVEIELEKAKLCHAQVTSVFDKFVEDIVRDIAARLNDDDRINAYTVESENFESIHNHSAYALITHGFD